MGHLAFYQQHDMYALVSISRVSDSINLCSGAFDDEINGSEDPDRDMFLYLGSDHRDRSHSLDHQN